MVLTTVFLPAVARAEDGWVSVRSPHFELLSDASPDEARKVTESLERFRHVVSQLGPGTEAEPAVPALVYAFRDARSLEPFAPSYRGQRQPLAGFFQPGFDRNYIAIDLSAGGGRHEVAYHEYAHLFLRQRFPLPPPWLAEGLAELYASWELEGLDLVLGNPRPEHLRELRAKGLMPMATLLAVGYDSPLYNEGDRRGAFYAQSWALAHYLLVGERAAGSERVRELVNAFEGGKEIPEAFRRAFGADPADVQAKLEAYLASAPLPALRVKLQGEHVGVRLSNRVPSRAEVQCRLGDLLLSRGRFAQAQTYFKRALQADPTFAAAHEGLAGLYVQQLSFPAAKRHLQFARDLSPDSPMTLYRYADALVREALHRGEPLTSESEAEVLHALERAVALSPSFAEACDLLARLRTQNGSGVDEMIALVERAMALNSARVDLGLTLARLYLKKQDFARAARLLARTRDSTHDEGIRAVCELTLRRIADFTKRTAEIQGLLVRLACLPDGALDFVVEGQGRSLRLRTASAKGVFLYHVNGEPLEMSFTCGPQRLPVVARYVPSGEDGRPGADGTLLTLTFSEIP